MTPDARWGLAFVAFGVALMALTVGLCWWSTRGGGADDGD